MIDWKKANWKLSDTALAAVLGTSRQNVSAARKRMGAPPSPEKRGGDRKSLRSSSDSVTIRGVGEARKLWAKKAAESGKPLNSWMVEALNQAAST